jgi:hypothetical protein
MAERREPPDGWPKGRPLALSVNVMLEGWTDDSAPGIGPMGNPLKSGVLDLQGRSWADYGPKVGAWRILDILGEAGVTAVWYTSGILAERYPDLMRAIAERGHTVAAHAWAQNILPAYQSAEDEAADLDRCLRVIEAGAGGRARGFLSPRCTPSERTTALLAANGFDWHADTFDADLPYIVETRTRPIVAMPFTMEVNDMPLYIRYGNEPEAFTRILGRILDHWAAIGNRPGCLDLTVHAHVFGRPYGLIELKESLARAKRCAAAWLTDHAELAAIVAGRRPVRS